MLEEIEEFNHEKLIEEFEALTKGAGKVQKETLKKILEENGKAEYLQKLGLNGRTDPESFKACVPLVTHKDLEPYIQKIVDGRSCYALTGKPVTAISLSSGTTEGRQKFIPFNEELLKSSMQIFQTSFAFRNREFPIGNGKALQFIYGSKQFQTRGGLPACTATTNLYRSSLFKNTMKAIQSQSCSPDEVIFGQDYHQSLYCHLLCGLISRNQVQLVSSAFAHGIVHAFHTFEQVWEELCTDIRNGVLASRVTDPSARIAMSKFLKPNPELADLIYNTCVRLNKNWYGLIPELFPTAKYVYGIMTGSMEPYIKKLRHYAGRLPLMSADYGSTEGWIGANVNPSLPPELARFAILPDNGYFEFIPLRGELHVHEKLEPVDLTQVKIGQEYEIVITNFAGLYRYRIGDIVKVTSFHNSTPELQYVCRSNMLLNICIDKNTEKDLQLVVEEARKLLATKDIEVVDFTSHADMSSDPGHYVIFLEMIGDASEEILSECSNCLDRSFIDPGYVGSRKTNTIGPLELRVLRRGTFLKVLDHYLSLGAALSQFKIPRCVGESNRRVLEILCSNVAHSYFSTAFG